MLGIGPTAQELRPGNGNSALSQALSLSLALASASRARQLRAGSAEALAHSRSSGRSGRAGLLARGSGLATAFPGRPVPVAYLVVCSSLTAARQRRNRSSRTPPASLCPLGLSNCDLSIRQPRQPQVQAHRFSSVGRSDRLAGPARAKGQVEKPPLPRRGQHVQSHIPPCER